MILWRVKNLWTRFWMRFAGLSTLGRIATYLAVWFSPPYKARRYLARLNTQGYVAPDASICHKDLHLDNNVFLGERVVIYQAKNGGKVKIGKGASIQRDTIIETGYGGELTIGANTHIQPRCQFSSYKGSTTIGSDVEIAPNCAFYPYDHSFFPDELIKMQPLRTKGGIVIEDDTWLGFGVIVLDGVRIGKGAVIGAGSVVKHNIPDGAVAAGVPARVIKMRSDLPNNKSQKKKYLTRL